LLRACLAWLALCDAVAQTALTITERPVGLFTSFPAGPFFLWLLHRPPKNSAVTA
jgi:ABC-type Fe3+-siderophore transport system permease subunit